MERDGDFKVKDFKVDIIVGDKQLQVGAGVQIDGDQYELWEMHAITEIVGKTLERSLDRIKQRRADIDEAIRRHEFPGEDDDMPAVDPPEYI